MAKLARRCLIGYAFTICLTLVIPGFAMPARGPNNRQAGNEAKEFGPPEQKPAPPFSAQDQFGHEQTLKTLAGNKGTVLLFFRSADW